MLKTSGMFDAAPNYEFDTNMSQFNSTFQATMGVGTGSTVGGTKILYYDTFGDFPGTGNIKYFYVAKDTYKVYLWNSTSHSYVAIGGINAQYNTTAYWNAQTTLIPPAGTIIVYSDYKTITTNDETVYVPGIKIADGTAYLVDQPFVTDYINQQLLLHMADTVSHISQAERQFWNNKVSVTTLEEQIIFTTN